MWLSPEGDGTSVSYAARKHFRCVTCVQLTVYWLALVTRPSKCLPKADLSWRSNTTACGPTRAIRSFSDSRSTLRRMEITAPAKSF